MSGNVGPLTVKRTEMSVKVGVWPWFEGGGGLPPFASGRAGHRQEILLAAFEHQRRQHARGERAGVDADAVGLDLRLPRDRVPVDDDLAEILLAAEELLADPEHVLVGLVVERDAGADAGVDEEEVALGAREFERAVKLEVRFRHLPPEVLLHALEDLVGKLVVLADLDAVGGEGG